MLNNSGKNTEQQTIQLLIEEKSDLITERDKLLYQIEQLKCIILLIINI